MNKRTKHFDANTLGRDFAVGDLHGCKDALEQLLTHVNFDPSVDRLFSVGDLVDRGPDSWGCIALLEEPWFHAVLGNHEQLTIASLMCNLIDQGTHSMIGLHRDFDCEYLVTDKDMGMYVSTHMRHGGKWLLEMLIDPNMSDTERTNVSVELLKRLCDLPLTITVGSGEDRFNIVHAELYHSDDHFSDELIDNGEYSPNDIERMTWGRWLFYNRHTRFCQSACQSASEPPKLQEHLSTTYSGHTILPKPMRALKQINLDTGAYQDKETRGDWYTGALTIINTRTKQYYSYNTTTHQIITGEIK